MVFASHRINPLAVALMTKSTRLVQWRLFLKKVYINSIESTREPRLHLIEGVTIELSAQFSTGLGNLADAKASNQILVDLLC